MSVEVKTDKIETQRDMWVCARELESIEDNKGRKN